MIEERIVWHKLSEERPDPIKNPGPLITKRKSKIPFGIWWQMTAYENGEQMTGRKYKYWSANDDDVIEYWAEINGPDER